MDKYFEKVAEDENYYAYKNPYALGIAFGVSEAIKELETDFTYDYTNTEGLKNPFEVQNLLFNTLLGNDEDNYVDFFTPISLSKGSEIIGGLGSVGGGMEYSSTSADKTEDALEFNFTVENSGPLYLFLPTGYERGFTIHLNGEHYVQSTKYSRIISLGYREAGEELSITFRLDEEKLYFFKHTDYLYTLDMDAFEHAFEELAKTSLVTTEQSTDDNIFGSLTTYENNQTIMTTIPYDAGWKVFVDGKQVDTYSVYNDTLMAFNIENAGEHEIEFKYMPDIYVISGIISAVSLAVFAVIAVLEFKKSKKEVVIVSEMVSEENGEQEEAIEETEGEN